MEYIEFINDDIAYLDWVNQNSDGFVVNATKEKRKGYRVLHVAGCQYVTKLKGKSKEGGFTERSYIKICSDNVRALRKWAVNEGDESASFSQECARCKPWEKSGYEPKENNEDSLSLENISALYKKYFELAQFEVSKLGIRPTEARHLIGRLGEFYCALVVDGSISRVVNQHGFDVISASGRRISVKTTAQKSGFVAISSKTLEKVDDLMILQYKNGHLDEVYYGDIDIAISSARYYEHVQKYELDISKARKLA